MALRPGRWRSSATPIHARGLVYPLQNRRASKSATHGFASKSDKHHSKKHLLAQVLFATMCSARAGRDAPFGRDVDFVSDVRFAREESGTHHITLRHRRNTSLCVSTTSLRRSRNFTFPTLKFFEIL